MLHCDRQTDRECNAQCHFHQLRSYGFVGVFEVSYSFTVRNWSKTGQWQNTLNQDNLVSSTKVELYDENARKIWEAMNKMQGIQQWLKLKVPISATTANSSAHKRCQWPLETNPSLNEINTLPPILEYTKQKRLTWQFPHIWHIISINFSY